MKHSLWCLPLLLATLADAAPPELKITATNPEVAGDVLCVDASASVGAKSFAWRVHLQGGAKDDAERVQALEAARALLEDHGASITMPSQDDAAPFLSFDEATKIVLPSRAGYHWLVFVAAASETGEQDSELIERKIPGGTPGPPPDDDPPDDDPPDDDPPSGIVTDLSAQAKQWLATVPASARGPKADVALSLREIINANPPLGITEMELFLGITLPFAIGDKLPEWTSFATSANAALQALKSQGATADQYRAALKSIAGVLEQ